MAIQNRRLKWLRTVATRIADPEESLHTPHLLDGALLTGDARLSRAPGVTCEVEVIQAGL